MNFNNLTIVGRLTKDPECSTTTGGKNVAKFSLAVNSSGNGDDGKADYFDCVAWQKDADLIEQYAGKGRKMLVSGPIKSRSYTANDGSARKVWEVTVRQWELLDKPTEKTASATESEPYDPFS